MSHSHKKQKLQHQQPQQQQQKQQPQQQHAGAYRSLGLRLQPDAPFISYVFLKRHRPHEDEADIPNALYVTGLPLGLNEASLASIFGLFGGVTDVVLHPSKRSAALVYESGEGVSAALKHAGTGQIVECELPQQEGPVGLKAWVAAHKAARPGNDVLQQQLDAWAEAHEAAEAAKLAAQQAAMAEDGWTVVTRDKGRKRSREVGGLPTVSGGMPQAAAAAAAAARATATGARQAHQAETLYRFQAREQRRNELLELQQTFDAQRARLAALKAARHFKPS